MGQAPRHKFNVYTELYPAASVAVIGSGFVTITAGEIPAGGAIILSGIAIGLAGQLARSVHERKISQRHRN